jgi:CRP-like cAMP-binding protein
MRAPRAISLLDVFPDLGRDLSEAEFGVARRSIELPGAVVEPGPVDLAELGEIEHVRGPVLGAIVVDGLLTAHVELGDRRCTRLHGPGDLLVPEDDASDLLGASWSVGAERRSTLALLDDRFLMVDGRWPAVAGRLLVEAARQSQRALTHQAISQLPQVEERLLAVLTYVAERWGRVRRDGVAIDLPLTHELLAAMVGGRRPTVSLGLRALREHDLVRRQDGDWLLTGAASNGADGRTRGAADRGIAAARIHDLAGRFGDAPRFEGLVEQALDGAVEFLGADFGNVQVYDPQAKVLRIAAQRGFSDEFLHHFAEVRVDDGAACGRATTGDQIVLPDVNEDAGFAPHRAIAATAGFRAVQSTPLIDGSGRLRGVLSTHFRRVHRPEHDRLRLLRAYAQLLADALARMGPGVPLGNGAAVTMLPSPQGTGGGTAG